MAKTEYQIEDNETYYKVLKSCLDNADRCYIDGRMLWTKKSYSSSGGLLWLAMEQLIKINLITVLIENSEIEEYIKKDKKLNEKIKYDVREKDLNAAYNLVDETFRSFGGHELCKINNKVNDITKLSLKKYFEKLNIKYDPIYLTKIKHKDNKGENIGLQTLELLNALFVRRYVTGNEISICIKALDSIDKVYLGFRSNLIADIADCFKPSLIDELIIRNRVGLSIHQDQKNSLFEDNYEIHKYNLTNKKYKKLKFVTNEGINICYDGKTLTIAGDFIIQENQERKWR